MSTQPSTTELLQMLQEMGVTLPSPAYIAGAIGFGLVGIVAFRLGRKRQQPKTWGLGIVLMFYPYLVTDTLWMFVVGALLCAALWFTREG